MACPHCRRKVRLSHKSETVQSHFCETVQSHCRRKVRLSHSLTFLRQCGQGLRSQSGERKSRLFFVVMIKAKEERTSALAIAVFETRRVLVAVLIARCLTNCNTDINLPFISRSYCCTQYNRMSAWYWRHGLTVSLSVMPVCLWRSKLWLNGAS